MNRSRTAQPSHVRHQPVQARLGSLNRRLSRGCLIGILLAALVAPAEAFADSTNAKNWAGYAAHRAGLAFRQVSGRWRQPQASCSPGTRSYAAFWVGLGGFNPSSTALEQAGTEVDCGLRGHTSYYAWYELVPSRSVRLPASVLKVRPGDLIATTVSVVGNEVTILVHNETRHKDFRKVLTAAAVDVSSAEWIVEAPSGCSPTGNSCVALPLADFRSATFSLAQAQTSASQIGSISSPAWQSTKINLRPNGDRFLALAGGSTATPSALRAAGRSFKVTYSPTGNAAQASAAHLRYLTR